jgi:hypothetical protein
MQHTRIILVSYLCRYWDIEERFQSVDPEKERQV